MSGVVWQFLCGAEVRRRRLLFTGYLCIVRPVFPAGSPAYGANSHIGGSS